MYSGDKLQDLEDSLKLFGYKIEQPLKHFRTVDMKLKWIYDITQKNIKEWLSIASG
jgi:hypothetical protein